MSVESLDVKDSRMALGVARYGAPPTALGLQEKWFTFADRRALSQMTGRRSVGLSGIDHRSRRRERDDIEEDEMS